MRLISMAECKPGMRLGKPIYSNTGQTLINFRTELTDSMISRLSRMGYEYVYIDDPNTEGIFIEDTIKMETRMALRMTMEKLLSETVQNPMAINEGRVPMWSMCWNSVSMVVNDLRDARNDSIMLIHANSPKNVVGHFMQNAINVCVYATKIGILEGLQGKELIGFSLGALLHDVGNLQIPLNILEKPAQLTGTEFDRVKKHCVIGYDMLKKEPGMPLIAAYCALMHHERMDGSGYPFGLKGLETHPYARWIGIIDAYDAMTNPRPYKKALLPHEAMEILYAGSGSLYDHEKVELFRNKVAIFPVGLSVLLNTGESGIVSKVNIHCMQRPVIRILNDADGFVLKQSYEIDLSSQLHVMITGIGEKENTAV
ncbi:MAG: HD-GYP domain-containing protein [Paenibacillaceae bacterium]